jgi:hypothetical protein
MDERETLTYLRRHVNLAEDGKYECRYCKQVKPLTEGIVVTWGGQVFFALCPACFPGRPISIEQTVLSSGKPGVSVGFLKQGDAPLVELAGEHAVGTFTAGAALAQRRKKEFGS